MRCGLYAALAAAVLVTAASARAGVVDNDGATHTVSGSSPGITVFNATTLNVGSGASIVGSDGTYAGVYAFGPGTSVNVSAGTITGGTPPVLGLPAGPGINVFSGAGLTVSGGVIAGGGSAAAIEATNAGPVMISGGTFNNDGSVGSYSGFLESNGSPISISGGMFNNSAVVGVTSGAVATITGGTFNNPSNPLDLLGDSGGATIISGGAFNSGIELSLTNTASVTFLGANLSYSGGLLSGTLADGETISTTIQAGQPFQLTSESPTAIVFSGDPLPAVPEPATLGMLAAGLLGVLGIASRRRGSRP